MDGRHTGTNNNLSSQGEPSFSKQASETTELENAAKTAAIKVGPRTYRLVGIEDDEVRFYIFGCHGSGNESQKKVADLMTATINDQPADKKPHFFIVLGDNIYDYGVSSPFDKGFQDCFYDKYSKGLPYFLILGNHDENLHAKAFLSGNKPGESTALNEIAHTYLPDLHHESVEKKHLLYTQDTLPLNKLPQWNMPYFYYSIIAGDTQIFCLDSNTLPDDFLEDESHPDSKKQSAWLREEYFKAKEAGRKIIFALHHPVYTSGKRAFEKEHDSGHYLSADKIFALQKKLKLNSTSYNDFIRHIFIKLDLKPDRVLAAHDHFISYFHKENEPVQLTCGGGGGDLQIRESFAEHPHVLCHLSTTGFASMACSIGKPVIKTEIYTTANQHLIIDHQHQFICKESRDQQVTSLRQSVLAACDDYFNALKAAELKNKTEKPPLNESEVKTNTQGLFSSLSSLYAGATKLTHKALRWYNHDKKKAEEIRTAHDLMAYFNQPETPDLEKAAAYIRQCMEKLTQQNHAYPLFDILQDRIKTQFSGLDIQALHESFAAKASPN